MIRPGTLPLTPPLLASGMEPALPSPLRDLTTGLARGDDIAWQEFHRVYGPRLFRWFLAATRGDHTLASEALQQAYLRIARHARRCEVEAEFVAWLRRVTQSALSDCRRRRASFWRLLSRRREEPADLDSSSDARLEAALEIALAVLEPGDRALLEGKYFSGISVRDLAASLNLSAKAVESRLTRARAALRRQLQQQLSRDESST